MSDSLKNFIVRGEIYRRIVESANEGFWIVDTELKTAFVNQKTADIFGSSIAEMLESNVFDFIFAEDMPKIPDLRKRRRAGISDNYNFRYRLRNGSVIRLNLATSPLFDENGLFIGSLGIVNDITDRKNDERMIEHLAAIVESSNDAIIGENLNGIVTSWNRSAENLFGYTAAEIIGKPSSLLIPQHLGERESKILELIENSKNLRHFETVRRRKNDSEINISLTVSPIFDERGKIIGVSKIIRDITEALAAKAALSAAEARTAAETARLLEIEAEARAAAEAANRAKDEFLSVLSHELRTPLNAMYGWVRMLRAGMLDAEKSAHAVQVIERNVSLQNSLIEDLLDVSRIISGKLRIEQIPTDVVKLLESAIETIQPLAVQKDISLEFRGASESFIMLADEVRLQQIFANLLNNAVKFTTENGTVIIEISQTADRMQIVFCDNGIGIEKEFQPLIFDRFRQADGTTHRSYSGLGLGLTIVKHLTELHGGQIFVFSDGENCGTTFTLEFPMLETAAVIDRNFKPLIPTQSDDSVLSGKRIIIIDDNCDGLAPLEMILQMQNAEVECFDSGLHALELLSVQSYDLLVSDIGMPEIDGYELISRVRSKTDSPNCRIPAIALTAYAHSEDKNQAIASGFDRHVSKPVDFDDFLNAAKILLTDSNR